MRRMLVLLLLALVLAPGLVIALVTVGLTQTAHTWCEPGAVQPVAGVPDSLAATAADGTPVHLNRTQLVHAATIIGFGSRIRGVGRDGLVVALMAGLTESGLRMYANTAAYPESATYPHDADGSDHDSLGIFQMRPAAGWGSVAELMDPTHQARAFFGGPAGPNHGRPRGLLDIPGWHDLPKGAAAQAVEVSAYPDRYARYEPVAHQILTVLTAPQTGATPPALGTSAAVAPSPTTEAVFPLPGGTWTRTSGYGMRRNPVIGVWRLHAGVDLAAPAGTPILATGTGRVVHAGPRGGLGNTVALEHNVEGTLVVSVYGHLRDDGIHVRVGDLVAAGDWIGDVGSTGNSTGPHLHFELHPGGLDHDAVDPSDWLTAATSSDLATALASLPASSPGLCSPATDHPPDTGELVVTA